MKILHVKNNCPLRIKLKKFVFTNMNICFIQKEAWILARWKWWKTVIWFRGDRSLNDKSFAVLKQEYVTWTIIKIKIPLTFNMWKKDKKSLKILTGHSKILFLCRVSPISTRLSCYIRCIFKRPSLRLFRFKILQFVPFWIKNPQNRSKICKKRDKLWNFKSN